MGARYDSYFTMLEQELDIAYSVAQRARALGKDPSYEVEIPLAQDMASRVESLVGPRGIAKVIRELDESGMSRETVALNVAARICQGGSEMEKSEAAEQAVRSALAVLTEGIVSAPLEGIAGVKIRDNFDGTKYLAIYFAGPIRSAGGTAAALAVLIADYVSQKLHLNRYKVTSDEIERFIEEADLYNRTVRLQYRPSPDEIRLALSKIGVEITGETTDDVEITGHRDLPRIETNKLRGGAMLALCEGILQKSSKILKITKSNSIEGWEWLENVGLNKKTKVVEEKEVAPNWKYLSDIIAGRPIFSHPMARGGFRIRYGRSRNTGFAGWGIHPATMFIVDSFLAVGTQMKTERPGKANVTAPVDSIEGPIVKLKDGSVVRVETSEQAKEIVGKVEEILFLGDALIGYGEFLENNQPLLPSGYVEEWWVQELEAAGGRERHDRYIDNPFDIGEKDALRISEELKIPLHPSFTYHWEDIDLEDLRALVRWREDAIIEKGRLILKKGPNKGLLERICLPHVVEKDRIIIESETFKRCTDPVRFDKVFPLISKEGKEEKELVLEVVSATLGIKLRQKCPYTVGGRMGRPEKAKERSMSPMVHGLFPVGDAGGKTRSIVKAMGNNYIRVEVSNRYCGSCNLGTYRLKCPKCGGATLPYRICNNRRCNRNGHKLFDSDRNDCESCGQRLHTYSYKDIDIKTEMERAVEGLAVSLPSEVKGVIGMISADKFPEPLEKAILRSINGVSVFKDGTMRFDATDVPLTHFVPREVNSNVSTLLSMGYTTDIYGRRLEDDDQVLELKVQDIVLSDNAADYLAQCCRFIDDLLERYYGLPRFYNVSSREDLFGKLVIGLAPHTSAGVLGRIIGYTGAKVGYAHPFFHAAKRRNCDGDEDAIMLLMDALLNFSRQFLPEHRGGKMDAPLVLTTRIDPEEIDKEVHNLDISSRYPIEFYEKTQEFIHPSQIDLPTVSGRLGSERAFHDLYYTLPTRDIADGPWASAYKTLGAMTDKIESQLELARKIRAVDLDDTAQRVIVSHFIPDMIGNLHSFAKQSFRCVNCNTIFRRLPLSGRCNKCHGGRLVLTVSKGSVEKYLQVSKDIARRYNIDPYIAQRIEVIESELNSVFMEKVQQMTLADFAP